MEALADLVSLADFEREIGKLMPPGEAELIAAALDRKSATIGELLAAGRLDRAAARRLLRLTFATRRRADEILDTVGAGRLSAAIGELLAPDDDLAGRFDRFGRLLDGHPEASFDLPGELLHFSDPSRYWLWTRWLWDPRTGTGALGLVTTGELCPAASRGEEYLAAGRAIAAIERPAGPLATDVFLACVYGVYLYTVLRMRMTKEFNQLVPRLPDLARRLLGVCYQEV